MIFFIYFIAFRLLQNHNMAMYWVHLEILLL